jgi:membrane peptidoglycan carboxypeptidase
VATLALVGALALGVAFLAGLFVWLLVWFGQFAGALPPPDQLTAQQPFQTTRVLAADESTTLYEITDPQGGRRTIVSLAQMPRDLIEATIATEDAGFYTNPGFELRAIVRAGVDDLTSKEILSGASTITQQVVRNVLLTPAEREDQSARRKVKEIILAYQLTQTYTKDQILGVYLNTIPYGNHSFGVEAAAEAYFGKPVADLDLAQCALLAGLPQAPSYYDPYVRLDAVKQRQEYVLQRMVEQGYITAHQAQAADAETLHFVDRQRPVVAPHFVAYVTDVLVSQLGLNQLYHGGDTVVTTLDLPLQSLADQTVAADLPVLHQVGGNNLALVALDPQTGRILALVGSANYDDDRIAGEVDMALAPRASGGILSPLTYALALAHGDTLVTPLDRQTAVPGQVASPGSATDVVPLGQALAEGLSAPASFLMAHVGNQAWIDLAARIGLANLAPRLSYSPDLTIAEARVSPMEVAQVYATLAAGGLAHPPTAIDRIVAPGGKAVTVPRLAAKPALDPGVAYLVGLALSNPAWRPPADQAQLALAPPVAAHLGWSQDHRDAWAVGYVPNLVVVVWTGNSNGQALTSTAAAARIWRDYFQGALTLRPPAPVAVPADIVRVSLCQNPACTTTAQEPVLRGTEQQVEAANARAIAEPTVTTGNSLTPLVDRAPTPVATPTALAAPVLSGLVAVPELSGLSLEKARAALSAAGLASAASIQYRSAADLSGTPTTAAVGQVIRTSPAAGTKVAAGTQVVLIVRSS